jgi:hypothetical protein
LYLPTKKIAVIDAGYSRHAIARQEFAEQEFAEQEFSEQEFPEPEFEEPEIVRQESTRSEKMANADAALEELLTLRGALGAALVDYTSGMSLASFGGGSFNLELSAAGNSEVIRSKMKTLDALKSKSTIEDILVTLTDQYHLFRILPNHKGLFLYLVLKRADANLAIARHKLAEAEEHITF